MASREVRVAVVGAGSLGIHHARVYHELAGEARLVAVVDVDAEARRRCAERFRVRVAAAMSEVLDDVDAVSLVTPTALHHRMGLEILRAGRHLLVEKPITTDVAGADELIAAARERGLVLQVGHIEWFNPAVREVRTRLRRPRIVQAVRAGRFDPRIADVGVVLDLMIHDIDIVQALLGCMPETVEAHTARVRSGHEDIAFARLGFPSGCLCDLVASRISPDRLRRLSVYQDGEQLSADLVSRTVRITPIGNGAGGRSDSLLTCDGEEPLKAEVRQFLAAVRGERTPDVTGQRARDAVATARRILDACAA
jgi:predicted dehydrogenase